MLCSYDDLRSVLCTVLRGRYCVIQHLRCNENKTIIIITMEASVKTAVVVVEVQKQYKQQLECILKRGQNNLAKAALNDPHRVKPS